MDVAPLLITLPQHPSQGKVHVDIAFEIVDN